jgi:glycosyltransferase involved in cell wall biosynthesis
VRIAFVTGDPPWPPTAGGRLRDAATFEAAGKIGEVHLIAFPFSAPPDEARLPPSARVHPLPWPLTAFARAGLRARATMRRRHVFQEHLISRGAIQELCADLSDIGADVVILGYPLYGDLAAAARVYAPRLIVDLMELRSLAQPWRSAGLADRLRSWLDKRVLRHVEGSVASHADEVWFVTAQDAETYARSTGTPTRVVPNTVNASAYAGYRSIPRQKGRFAFLGSFDHAPNRHAAIRLVRRILPLVRRDHPDAELVLIGRRPPSAFRNLIARTAGASLHADAEDALKLLAANGPLVVPLESGSGTKLKLLEAAAACIPIVASRVGLYGLGFAPEREVLLAEQDADFAAAIERLWADTEFVERMTSLALARTVREYDRSVAIEAIRASIQDVASVRPIDRRSPADAR